MDMIRGGCPPTLEVFREVLDLNHDFLHGYDRSIIPEWDMHLNQTRMLEKGDNIKRESSPLGADVLLDSNLTEKYMVKKINELNDKGELKSIVSLLCAIRCLRKNDDHLLINKIFLDNIEKIIDDEREKTKIKNGIYIDVDKNNKNEKDMEDTTKFNIFSDSDNVINEIWIRLLGEYSLNFQNPELENYLNVINEKFSKNTREIAFFHRNLLNLQLQYPIIRFEGNDKSNFFSDKNNFITDKNNFISDNYNNNDNRNDIKISEIEMLPTSSNIYLNRAINSIINTPDYLIENGLPLILHYDLLLQALRGAEEYQELNKLQKHIQKQNQSINDNNNNTNNSSNYNDNNNNNNDNNIINNDKNVMKNLLLSEMREYHSGLHNIKNNKEMILFGVNIAENILNNKSIAGSLSNCQTDDEFYCKKYANLTVINSLEKAYDLAIEETKRTKLSDLQMTGNGNSSNNIDNINSKNDINAYNPLKNVVLLFNAISVCNFPHATKSYVDILTTYLRVMELDADGHKKKVIANGLKKRILEQEAIAAAKEGEIQNNLINGINSNNSNIIDDNIVENNHEKKNENEIKNIINEKKKKIPRNRIRSVGVSTGNSLIRQFTVPDKSVTLNNCNNSQNDINININMNSDISDTTNDSHNDNDKNDNVHFNANSSSNSERRNTFLNATNIITESSSFLSTENNKEIKLKKEIEKERELELEKANKAYNLEILCQAVDLYEDILITNRKVDTSFWRMLVEGIIAAADSEELFYRLYISTPFSFWYKVKLKYKLTVIIKMLSLLDKHEDLLLFSINILSVNQTRVHEDFKFLSNWERIIKSLSILKKIENENENKNSLLLKSEQSLQNNKNNLNEYQDDYSYHQTVNGHPFHRFSNDSNKPEKKSNLSIIDQNFFDLINNGSKLRLFVDDDIFILNIVDLLIVNDLQEYAFKFLHECLDNCYLSKPKSKSKSNQNYNLKPDLNINPSANINANINLNSNSEFLGIENDNLIIDFNDENNHKKNNKILQSGISNYETENEILVEKLKSLRRLRDLKNEKLERRMNEQL